MFVRTTNKQSAPPDQRPADAAAMRSHNVGLVLRHLVRGALGSEDSCSRADVARATGLARSTVSTIAHELIEAGIIAEGPVTASRGGRPPIALRVERDRHHILGVELGASHVTVVRTDLLGTPLAEARADHPVQCDPAGAMAVVGSLVAQVCGPAERARVLGLGLAVPSPLDPARPGLLSERILPAWAGIRPGDRIAGLLDVPVSMENDANLGALAESLWGSGMGGEDFAYIKVATGVGAGLFINGAMYRGAAGLAGEIGHTAIDPGGPRCRCGLNGCLEAMIGSGALVERARRELRVAAGSRLVADAVDLPAIIAAARAGDALAGSLIADAGRHLGVAIANLLNLLNPGVVVLGGTLASAGEELLRPLRRAMAERSLSTSLESTDVRVSPLGDQAVALGAVGLVLQQALEAPERFLSVAQASAAR